MPITKNKFPWGQNKEWKERTQKIATYIKAKQNVIELGCGYGHLKKYLKNCKYTGLDQYEWTEGVIPADFNKGEYPDLGLFDQIVCQGILEYIDEPKTFLEEIKKYGNRLILTYKEFAPSDIVRRNIISFQELDEMLSRAGWETLEYVKINSNQNLFICIKR